MEHQALLMEYLKEQYQQARQHETRQTNATVFLTAAAGAVFGYMAKNGIIEDGSIWFGLILIFLGGANCWINKAHFNGNRFHVKLAGKVRREIERSIESWPKSIKKTSTLRQEALSDMGLLGPDVSIGENVYRALQVVPIGVFILGSVILAFSIENPICLVTCGAD
jgi:hypothetical protein